MDAIVWVLFLLRVTLLAAFGIALTWVGLESLRPGFYVLGTGLFILSIAGYFNWHPSKPSKRWFLVLVAPGLLLVVAGFALHAA